MSRTEILSCGSDPKVATKASSLETPNTRWAVESSSKRHTTSSSSCHTSKSLQASVSRQWRHPLVEIEQILRKSFWSHFPTWNPLSFDGILHIGSSLLAALEERLAKSSTLVWRMVLATPFRSPFLDCTTACLICLLDFQLNFCSRCTLCPCVYTDVTLSIVYNINNIIRCI